MYNAFFFKKKILFKMRDTQMHQKLFLLAYHITFIKSRSALRYEKTGGIVSKKYHYFKLKNHGLEANGNNRRIKINEEDSSIRTYRQSTKHLSELVSFAIH